MFENRLKWFSILLAGLGLLLVARLAEIQILRADQFEALADRILTRPVRYLPAVRGSILDRSGRPLVQDVGAFDVGVHYAVLAGGDARQRYFAALARAARQRGELPAGMSTREYAAALEARLADDWRRLAQLTGLPPSDLLLRGDAIHQRIARIRETVAARRGVNQPIAEESMFHSLIESTGDATYDATVLAVRTELADVPWIDILPGSRRVTHDADALAHVLGRMGAVSPTALQRDPLDGDELRELRPGERCGISGVETLAETVLRGSRGRVVEDFGDAVMERTDQQRGDDVTLTIDVELQRQVLALLERHVGESLFPAGGAVVVLDAATREVLALASFPTYALDEFNQDYTKLAGDARRLPLLSRCVQAEYPPGSICKIAAMYGALADRKTDPATPIVCNGQLLENNRESFCCWYFNRYGLSHGEQTAVDAIRNSCNIYLYTIGERLGAQRLCEWFERFGLGRTQGTGLVEESAGILPTPAWLFQQRGRTPQRADAWNFAIGQGEVTATPLQAANAAATVASGRWAAVRLFRDYTVPADAPPPDPLLDATALQTVRTGMWMVVNDANGTAREARLDRRDYVLCGKTGSAEAVPRPVSRLWTLEWPDGRRETVVGGFDEAEVLAPYVQRASAEEPETPQPDLSQPDLSQHEPPQPGAAGQGAMAKRSAAMVPRGPKIVGYRTHERFPPWSDGEPLPSHAWFIGFTQSADTPRGGPPRGRVYAIAAMIEFAGSGGHAAGPLAKEVAELMLSTTQEQ